MMINGNPNTNLHEVEVISSGVPLYGICKNPTRKERKAPRVILNSEMTPKGPDIATGAISEINIGHKTENAPAENPWINLPIHIVVND